MAEDMNQTTGGGALQIENEILQIFGRLTASNKKAAIDFLLAFLAGRGIVSSDLELTG